MQSREIGEKLIEYRGKRPQKQVANDLGISQSALAMYESGERVPRDELKKAMARYYGTSVGALFFGEEVHRTCIMTVG